MNLSSFLNIWLLIQVALFPNRAASASRFNNTIHNCGRCSLRLATVEDGSHETVTYPSYMEEQAAHDRRVAYDLKAGEKSSTPEPPDGSVVELGSTPLPHSQQNSADARGPQIEDGTRATVLGSEKRAPQELGAASKATLGARGSAPQEMESTAGVPELATTKEALSYELDSREKIGGNAACEKHL